MTVESVLTPLLARTLVVEAVHAALRVIRFREGAERLMGGLRGQARDKDEVAKVALTVLEDIQTEEKRPLKDLTDEQAEQYSQRLAQLVEARIRKDWNLDESVAESKLNDIRAAYKAEY